MTGYWWGDAPRIVIPVEIHPKQKLGAPAARVFGALIMRADNKSGLVDSTVKQLAQDAEMGESQVKVGLKALIASGYVTQLRHGNSRLSNKYQLHGSPVSSNRSDIRPVNQPDIRPVQPEPAEDDDPMVDQQIPQTEQPEIRLVDPNGAAGNPAQTSRKTDLPLLSPYLSPKDSFAYGGSEGDEQPADDGSLPGLLVVAPQAEPKAKTRARKSRRRSYPEAFEAFWAAYPIRDGQRAGRKEEVHREWEALLADDTAQTSEEALLLAAQAYAATKPRYIYNADNWLSGDMWRDYAGRAQTGDLTDDRIIEILGEDLQPLPPLPPGVHPASPEAAEQRARDRAERRAARLAEAITRMNHRSAS